MPQISHRVVSVPLANGATLQLGRHPLIMGILNITPDSFSDGGAFASTDAALAQARTLAAEGADIIDIGGESTRPGADEVSVQQELDRVMPVLDAIRLENIDKIVSIDTYKALVADQAIQAGASIINDVHGLQREPEIADVAAQHNVPVIAMHWDQERNTSKDLIDEVRRYFDRTLDIATRAGIAPDRIIFDPGFGFGKTLPENYELLRRLPELVNQSPIKGQSNAYLAGLSRKSMIGKLLGVEPSERVFGTVATTVLAYAAGAHIFRVHDVRANRDALRVAAATLYGPAHTET